MRYITMLFLIIVGGFLSFQHANAYYYTWEYKDWSASASDQYKISKFYIIESPHISNHYHDFGFVTKGGNCNKEVLYISFSADDNGIADFDGVYATIQFRVGGIQFKRQIQLSKILDLSPEKKVIQFTNNEVDDELIDIFIKGDVVEVTVLSPKELVGKLDSPTKTYSLSGFIAARSKSKEFCESVQDSIYQNDIASAEGMIDISEIARHFYTRPFVHPNLIRRLSAFGYDRCIVIELPDFPNDYQYINEIGVKHIQGEHPIIGVMNEEEWEYEGETMVLRNSFDYQYIGKTETDIHILYFDEWGGGSGFFRGLLLVAVERDYELVCDWDALEVKPSRERVLLKKLGELHLGDRWVGELKVNGNEILIGKDQGWFTVSGGTGGGHLSQDIKDRTIRIYTKQNDNNTDSN